VRQGSIPAPADTTQRDGRRHASPRPPRRDASVGALRAARPLPVVQGGLQALRPADEAQDHVPPGRPDRRLRRSSAGYDRPMPFVIRILVGWAVDAAALAIAAWIFSGISVGGSAGTLILAALIYGILATFVKPVLKLLTLPLAIVTLGIAWFFVAMFILW